MKAAEHLLATLLPNDQLERVWLVEPLPLASPERPADDGKLRYAIGRIDESGSVPAAYVLHALGWCAGDRLTITVRRGVAVVQRDANGQVAVSKRRAFVIPAAARRACGIRAQDALFLAAAVEHGVVFVHPPTIVDRMVTLYHRSGPHG
jgi:bifunctional DNA-binding transcriptional regulator/antitoxin component of YhaV-PrlF toxin-antitoxin module